MNAKRIPIEKEIIIKVQDSFDDDSHESDSQHKLNQIQESNRENNSQKNEIDPNIVADGEYQNMDSKEDESGKIIVKKRTKGNESKVRKENVRKKLKKNCEESQSQQKIKSFPTNLVSFKKK